MMTRNMISGAMLGLILASAAKRSEATEYAFTLLDYPGERNTEAVGINDLGQIVGYYYQDENQDENVYGSFFLSDGVYTSFDPPATVQSGSLAQDINNAGQIGGYYDAGWRLHGFLRTGDDYADLVLPGDPGNLVTGINDLGQAVGYRYPSANSTSGILFDGDNYTIIDYPGAAWTELYGINNRGAIVGFSTSGNPYTTAALPRGFLLENGTFTPIGVPGFPGAIGTGINEHGDIVGITGMSFETRRAFVLAGGEYSILDVPGALTTVGKDINNLGHVVGSYRDASGIWHGFLATPIAAADFNKDGVVDGGDLAQWEEAYGVSAVGDADEDGDTDGADFLIWQRQFGSGLSLTAANATVPEPASLWLVMMALAGSVLAARNAR